MRRLCWTQLFGTESSSQRWVHVTIENPGSQTHMIKHWTKHVNKIYVVIRWFYTFVMAKSLSCFPNYVTMAVWPCYPQFVVKQEWKNKHNPAWTLKSCIAEAISCSHVVWGYAMSQVERKDLQHQDGCINILHLSHSLFEPTRLTSSLPK